jgi:hypothetical protein
MMSMAPMMGMPMVDPFASFVAAEVSGFGGKPAPAQPDHPER